MPPLGYDPYRRSAAPDPYAHPEAYDGILSRRVFAYLIDVLIIAVIAAILWFVLGIATVLTFGLLAPLKAFVLVLLPFCYHILLIAGADAATIGMRLMDIEVRSFEDGRRPSLGQAAVQVVVFYGSVALTSTLILLWALFNQRQRTLHDYVAGTVVLRRGHAERA